MGEPWILKRHAVYVRVSLVACIGFRGVVELAVQRRGKRGNRVVQQGDMADSSSINAQSFDSIYELSRLLNTGLDRETLAILLQLLQQGVNPEALADVVRDLRREAESTQDAAPNGSGLVSAAAVDYTQRQFEPPQQEPMKKRRSDYH